MTMTGLETFDTSVQKSDAWLKALMEKMGWDSRQRAYVALRAVLHSLRDNLTVDEAADLSAQLPLVIRGIYYESWKPSAVPVKDRHPGEFLERVRGFFGLEDIDAEAVARGVFELLQERITAGEIDNVRAMVPAEIRKIWDGVKEPSAAG